MREAVARSDLDFILSESAAPARRGSRKIARKHSALWFGCGFAALLCIAVIVNALFLQERRHAAPLFRPPVALDSTPKEADVPQPTPRPASIEALINTPAAPVVNAAKTPVAKSDSADAIGDILRGGAKPAPAPAAKSVVAPAPVAKPVVAPVAKSQETKAADKKQDSIASLLHSAPAAKAQPAAAPDVRIMAAQRALVRMGYVLRADGHMNAATRGAIQSVERDQKWATTGTLSPRVMKELSARTGIAVE